LQRDYDRFRSSYSALFMQLVCLVTHQAEELTAVAEAQPGNDADGGPVADAPQYPPSLIERPSRGPPAHRFRNSHILQVRLATLSLCDPTTPIIGLRETHEMICAILSRAMNYWRSRVPLAATVLTANAQPTCTTNTAVVYSIRDPTELDPYTIQQFNETMSEESEPAELRYVGSLEQTASASANYNMQEGSPGVDDRSYFVGKSVW
jgi:hypothetical protein